MVHAAYLEHDDLLGILNPLADQTIQSRIILILDGVTDEGRIEQLLYWLSWPCRCRYKILLRRGYDTIAVGVLLSTTEGLNPFRFS
jgi:hypothetical protein